MFSSALPIKSDRSSHFGSTDRHYFAIALQLGFDYLETLQVKKIWNEFFGGNCPKVIFEQDEVSISDFTAVSQKFRYMPDNLKTSELIAEYMLDEITNKDDHYGRRLGL